jgi:hypothetical protein
VILDKVPAPALSQDTPSQPNQPKQDLVDTFDLFKTYLDHKLHDLKSDIISEQENLSLKVKEQVNLKFKSEGNKIQFRFNEEIAADLAKLQKHCTSSVNNSLVTDICDKLKSRNKLTPQLGVGPPFANTSKMKLRKSQMTKKEFYKLTCSLTFKDKFSCTEIISDFKSCNLLSRYVLNKSKGSTKSYLG